MGNAMGKAMTTAKTIRCSVALSDSVHLRKCELWVGVCQEALWRYMYQLCLAFRDGEAELRKKKVRLNE